MAEPSRDCLFWGIVLRAMTSAEQPSHLHEVPGIGTAQVIGHWTNGILNRGSVAINTQLLTEVTVDANHPKEPQFDRCFWFRR